MFLDVFQYGEALTWGEHSSDLCILLPMKGDVASHGIALVRRDASGRRKMGSPADSPCSPSSISSMKAFVPFRVFLLPLQAMKSSRPIKKFAALACPLIGARARLPSLAVRPRRPLNLTALSCRPPNDHLEDLCLHIHD